MSGDQTSVAPIVLRASANKWFPDMAAETANVFTYVAQSRDQAGSAFSHPGDWVNGISWSTLVGDFEKVLQASAVRLGSAGDALLKAADSYEDSDQNSAFRIDSVSD